MRQIAFADGTLASGASTLSFREKIETAKLLDRLGVDVIETAPVTDARMDTLLIKSIATAVEYAAVSVPAALSEQGVDDAWEAVREAKHPRIRMEVPMSPVRMEYVCRKKPPMMLSMVEILVSRAAEKCEDVEFVADDATRADFDFLCSAIEKAIAAGATAVTLCDTAGVMLPQEFAAFIGRVKEAVPQVGEVTIGARCSNQMTMSCACAVEAIRAGADEIKTAACDESYPLIEAVENVLRSRAADFGVKDKIDFTRISRTCEQIRRMMQEKKSKNSPFDNGVHNEEQGSLSVHDDAAAVSAAVKKLGYDLSEEDAARVFEAFRNIADKKSVSYKELDVIVASSALQVPATYRLQSYVVNTGNVIGATAHVRLERDDTVKESVVVGDGPIDAAFLAIEKIVGRHYELDDFRIQAVTEGREAMGSALIRLRADGKLYAGRGISTDIIGACIRAYLNALNKIVYEEEQA